MYPWMPHTASEVYIGSSTSTSTYVSYSTHLTETIVSAAITKQTCRKEDCTTRTLATSSHPSFQTTEQALSTEYYEVRTYSYTTFRREIIPPYAALGLAPIQFGFLTLVEFVVIAGIAVLFRRHKTRHGLKESGKHSPYDMVGAKGYFNGNNHPHKVRKMSGVLKRQIPVSTILIVIIAFSAGVATGSYFGPLLSQNRTMSTFTNVVTVPTTPAQPSISTTSSILYSSSTSTPQVRTSASQRPKWISSDTNVIPWTQASSYLNQYKTVEGTIVYTKVSGSNVFLDFHYPYQGYFYAYIPSASNFGFSPASFYLNKEVRVTGTIVLYKGSPEIIVNSPSQIEVAYMGFNYP